MEVIKKLRIVRIKIVAFISFVLAEIPIWTEPEKPNYGKKPWECQQDRPFLSLCVWAKCLHDFLFRARGIKLWLF
jgi:hypothetical protein